MIKTVTLRPIAPFTCKAFVINGLAIVTDGDGEFIYHEKPGLMISGWPIAKAKNALQVTRELIATGVDWEGLNKEGVLKLPPLIKKSSTKLFAKPVNTLV